MKSYVFAFLGVLLIGMLMLGGCSRPSQTNTPAQVSPEAAPPAISAPAETAPVAPAPPANTPTRPAKQQPKVKPAAPARPAAPVAEPVPAQPEVKTETQPVEKAVVPDLPKVRQVTLPAGTLIPVRMIDSVNSETDQVGQTFRASIDSDIMVDGQTAVRKGADARLKLNRVSSAGKVRGKSELELQLDRIVVGKDTYNVVSNVIEREAAAEGKKTARDVAVGGAVGAAIGAIAGGKKGAAIGAGVGAGSGAAVAVITKGEQVVVASESRLEFRLEQPVTIVVHIPAS